MLKIFLAYQYAVLGAGKLGACFGTLQCPEGWNACVFECDCVSVLVSC